MDETGEPGTISITVDCPWCIAKAGELCYLQGPDGTVWQSSYEAHLARVVPRAGVVATGDNEDMST